MTAKRNNAPGQLTIFVGCPSSFVTGDVALELVRTKGGAARPATLARLNPHHGYSIVRGRLAFCSYWRGWPFALMTYTPVTKPDESWEYFEDPRSMICPGPGCQECELRRNL